MTEKLLDSHDLIREKDFLENFEEIKAKIYSAAEMSGRSGEDIILLAATKTVPISLINFAAANGLEYMGENKVQEFTQKLPALDKRLRRHFIGHLQTNKVKYIVGNVELIHSVDSVRLAEEISKQSVKRGIVSDILLEVNIGEEESKSGFRADDVHFAVQKIASLEGVCLKGLMCIPPDEAKNGPVDVYFDKMRKLFVDISTQSMDNNSMQYLSMGMSADFEKAIKYGANIVRIGSALFGERNYQ